MTSITGQIEVWWAGLGLAGVVIIFVLGIFADETVRGIYHWLFDRRWTHFWRWVRVRRAVDIPIEVRQTFQVAVDQEEGRGELGSFRERLAHALLNDFDQVARPGESVLEARSKRSNDFTIRADIVEDAGRRDSVNVTVTTKAKVTFGGISDCVTQAIVELQKAGLALSQASGGLAPKPGGTGVTLTVKINKPPEILETLRQFKISNFEGRADDLSIEFGTDHATFVGEPGQEMTKAVRDVVTWYY